MRSCPSARDGSSDGRHSLGSGAAKRSPYTGADGPTHTHSIELYNILHTLTHCDCGIKKFSNNLTAE